MERLLFTLAQMECLSATWWLAAARSGEADRSIARAAELLGAIDPESVSRLKFMRRLRSSAVMSLRMRLRRTRAR